MQTYKITLIKELDFPRENLEYLTSPIGKFARDITHKKWLEAEVGSIGHILITDFAKQFPGCFTEEIIETTIEQDFTSMSETVSTIENSWLLNSLNKRTRVQTPKKTMFRIVDGIQQKWNGYKWIDTTLGL